MTDVTAALPAPDGYVVDFDNPERRADVATYWCFGVGMSLAMLFTAQRVYVKLGIGTGWRLDDWLLTASWVFSMIAQVCVVYGFANKFIGVHVWEISIDQLNRFLVDLYISAPVYTLAGSCAKCALLVFYLRLSPQRGLRYSVFATMVFIVGYTIGIFFSLLFACNPVEKSFNALVTEGTCISTASLYIATAVFNIASDVVLFVLPLPMISGLQMPRKQKLGLVFIFGIGSTTVFTSIMRAVLLPVLLTSADTTWDVAYASMLIIVEANLIIICGMLPTLRKFFRHVAPKLIGESTYGKHTGNSNGNLKYGNPALLTFGSMPTRDKKQRSQLQYEAYDLDTFTPFHADGYPDRVRAAQLAVPNQQWKKEGVDTVVVAIGNPGYDSSDGRHSRQSGESQMPIMGPRVQGGGIRTTTRIEVTYGRDPEMMPHAR